MPTRLTTYVAAGGRTLDVMLGGAERGPALVAHHGTPSDATLWSGWDDVARANGLQLIAISRPGYAESARRPGRRVADVAADVEVVLDRLAVPWFVTAGWSGGGPHALACAALLGDRCRGVATLAGVGPYERDDLDFLDGMGPENIDEFGAALSSESELREWLERHAKTMRDVSGRSIVAAFGGLIPQVDKDALNAGFAGAMAATIRRGLAPGFNGWIDDDLAFINDWGFDLAAIAAPVTVWQGDLDLMVPPAHGVWLTANIPTATQRMVPGHGHISLFTTYREEIVASLIPSAPER